MSQMQSATLTRPLVCTHLQRAEQLKKEAAEGKKRKREDDDGGAGVCLLTFGVGGDPFGKLKLGLMIRGLTHSQSCHQSVRKCSKGSSPLFPVRLPSMVALLRSTICPTITLDEVGLPVPMFSLFDLPCAVHRSDWERRGTD